MCQINITNEYVGCHKTFIVRCVDAENWITEHLSSVMVYWLAGGTVNFDRKLDQTVFI